MVKSFKKNQLYFVPRNRKEFDKQSADIGWVKCARLGRESPWGYERTSSSLRFVPIKIW